jgi:hypothetical protein
MDTFKFKITLDRHNAIQNLHYYDLPNPPRFSLPSTFDEYLCSTWTSETLQLIVIFKCLAQIYSAIRVTGFVQCTLLKITSRRLFPVGLLQQAPRVPALQRPGLHLLPQEQPLGHRT